MIFLLFLALFLFSSVFTFAMEEEQNNKTQLLSLVEICAQAYSKGTLERCKLLDIENNASFINGSERRPYTLNGYKLQGKNIYNLSSELRAYAMQTLFENAAQEYSIDIPLKKSKNIEENVDPVFIDLLKIENNQFIPDTEKRSGGRYAASVSSDGNFCFTLEQIGKNLGLYGYDKNKNYKKSLLMTLQAVSQSSLEKFKLLSVGNGYLNYSVRDGREEKEIVQTFDGKLVIGKLLHTRQSFEMKSVNDIQWVQCSDFKINEDGRSVLVIKDSFVRSASPRANVISLVDYGQMLEDDIELKPYSPMRSQVKVIRFCKNFFSYKDIQAISIASYIQSLDNKFSTVPDFNDNPVYIPVHVSSDDGSLIALCHRIQQDSLEDSSQRNQYSTGIDIINTKDWQIIKSFTLKDVDPQCILLKQLDANYLLFSIPVDKCSSSSGYVLRVNRNPLCSLFCINSNAVLYNMAYIPQFCNENENGYISHEALLKQVIAQIVKKRAEEQRKREAEKNKRCSVS